MNDSVTDAKHFIKAVTELGEKCPVMTTQAIFNDRGIKILEQGVAVNDGLYERLMAHTLAIPLEDSVAGTPTVTGPLLRAQAERAMRELPFFERIGSDAKTRNLLFAALEELLLPSAMAFQLTLAHEVRPALFRHSIHMALFAAWLSLGPLVPRYDVSLAAAAGLLHDIGMLHLDPVLLTPRSHIGRDQKRQLDAHALLSVTLIERHHQYPRALLRAVKEHHEFLDGSGSPLHLRDLAISPMGRILSLGELVTTILAREPEAAELRLSVLLRMNKHRYDPALVERVLQHLQPPLALHGTSLALLPDPVKQLLAIDATLSEWPSDLVPHGDLNAPRREGMAAVAGQVAQLRRTLATVGVAPRQLEQLGGDALDSFLQLELTLLAQEAAWQLRALARNTSQRWRLQPDEPYPAALQAWLDRADALVADISSATTTQRGDTE